MVKENYIPNYGDIVWVNFDPTIGREQKGRRPAIIISSFDFNKKTNLAFVCPITNTNKNYPFRIQLESQKVKGFVMTEQLRSISWQERKVEFIEKGDKNTLLTISNLIEAITQPF